MKTKQSAMKLSQICRRIELCLGDMISPKARQHLECLIVGILDITFKFNKTQMPCHGRLWHVKQHSRLKTASAKHMYQFAVLRWKWRGLNIIEILTGRKTGNYGRCKHYCLAVVIIIIWSARLVEHLARGNRWIKILIFFVASSFLSHFKLQTSSWIAKLKLSRLSYHIVVSLPFELILSKILRYEADMSDSVVFFISSSSWYVEWK
jgi:hypothetical protein